jgi:flagellar basal body-associated protein FliL
MDNINQVVQTPPNLPPEHSSSRGLKIAVLILIALIVLVGGAFAYYYYFIFPKESLPITLVPSPIEPIFLQKKIIRNFFILSST